MSHRLRQLKRRVRRPLEWLGIFAAQLVFAHVSHRVLLLICDAISGVGYYLDRYGRELSRRNLRIVFHGREIPRRREELILRRSYRNMMRTMGHIFWTSRKAAKRAKAVGELSPACHEVLARYRPAVTVSGHLGCWEVLSQLVYLEGREIVSVAKDIGSAGMTELLMKGRRSLGQKIVPAEGAFRPLYEGMRNGADVGLLVDQVVKPKNGGVWVWYFDRPVPVSVAPAFLSAKTHAPILLAWCRPLKDGRYRCELIAEFPWEKGMDVWGRTQAVMSALERTIRRHPSCWVLNYRYFRKFPTVEELKQLQKRTAERKAKEDRHGHDKV
jgi:lauroyl/myristoyl acyltransferase